MFKISSLIYSLVWCGVKHQTGERFSVLLNREITSHTLKLHATDLRWTCLLQVSTSSVLLDFKGVTSSMLLVHSVLLSTDARCSPTFQNRTEFNSHGSPEGLRDKIESTQKYYPLLLRIRQHAQEVGFACPFFLVAYHLNIEHSRTLPAYHAFSLEAVGVPTKYVPRVPP